jgi:hypothetical protein
MFKLERIRTSIYVMFVTLAIPLWSNDVELNKTNMKEIQLSSKYEDYINIFSKEEASKFPDFTRVEHFILIKEDVEVSYNSIY